MAWSNSKIFQQAMLNPLLLGAKTNNGTGIPTSYGATGILGDTIDVALFGTLTPDNTVAVGSTGYNTGVWTTGAEITDTSGGSHWNAGGVALASKTFAIDAASSSICFGAAYTTGTGTVTLVTFFGCLVYDFTITGGTVAKQGLCYNYFGGTQTITGGTFTIQWATVGGIGTPNGVVFNITV
jgi:hypothetical protein